MLTGDIASKNNPVHKQISVSKQNLILKIFPTALRYAEVHFRCVLCGYRRVRRSPHSDHRVGTHRGNMGHLHQHYHELLRPPNQRHGNIRHRCDIRAEDSDRMENVAAVAVTIYSRRDFPYAN